MLNLYHFRGEGIYECCYYYYVMEALLCGLLVGQLNMSVQLRDNPNIIWFVAEQLRPTTLDAMPVGIFHNSHMGTSCFSKGLHLC